MLDMDRKWPLGATRIGTGAYLGLLLVILLALGLIDYPVADWARTALAPTRGFFEIVTIPGDSVWTLVPALAAMVLGLVFWGVLKDRTWKQRARTVAALAGFVFAGVAVPGLLANLIKRGVGRARPVHLEDLGMLSFQPFEGWDFQSFPSGDTTTVFALAAIALFFFPRFGWLVLAGAVMVGAARIALGMHFPTDVYGGILLGTFGAVAVRNVCASRGWLFKKDSAGRIIPDLTWN